MSTDRKLNTSYNIGLITIVSIICEVLWIKSGVTKDAGMAALILNWLPLLLGVFTIVLYFLARIFTKKFAWVLSLLGVLLIIATTIRAFFE